MTDTVEQDGSALEQDSLDASRIASVEKRAQSLSLLLDQPIHHSISGDASVDLTLELEAEEYAHVRVEQLGADVLLELRAPDGTVLTRVDSPTGNRGFEDVYVVARAAGPYRLVVRSLDPPESTGAFSAHVATRRQDAGPVEHNRVRGTWAYARAEEERNGRDYNEAMSLYDRARDYFREAKDAIWEGKALMRSAQLRLREQPAEATEALIQARTLFQQTGETRLEAITLGELGTARLRAGASRSAQTAHQSALQLFESLEDPLGQATALNNLGFIYKRTGQVLRALAAYRRAADLWRQLERTEHLLATESNLAKLLLSLGRLDQAVDLFESCTKAAQELGDPASEATCLAGQGDIAQRQGRFSDALTFLNRALEIYERNGTASEQGVLFNSFGNTYLRQGETEKAGEHYRRALRLFERQGDLANQAASVLNLGRYQFARGEFAAAATYYRKALGLYRQVGNRSGEAATLLGEAHAAYRRGQHKTAEDIIQGALAVVELIRQETGESDLRASVVAEKSAYWELYIHILMERHRADPEAGHDRRALEVCERWRSRSLLELLRGAQLNLHDGTTQDLAEEEAELRRLIADLHLQGLDLDGPEQNPLREEIAARLRSAQLDAELLRARIRTASTRPTDLGQLEAADASTIQRELLGADTRLLQIFLGEERSYAWLVSQQQISSFELPRRELIDRAVDEVVKLLRSRSDRQKTRRQRALRNLSGLILEPLAESLGDRKLGASTSRLVVVADGRLQAIPFAILPVPDAGDASLLDWFEVVHLPSASVLAALRERQRRRPDPASLKIAIYGDAVYHPEDERLPRADGTLDQAPHRWKPDLAAAVRDLGISDFDRLYNSRGEAEVIAELVAEEQRTLALGFAASRQSLLAQDLEEYSVLHFATHGILNRAHPELSGLVLSLLDEAGQPQDGFLRLQDIYNLRLQSELVTLSACQTGLGAEVRGEGLIGLTRGFMFAGSQRVLVSLWQVDDAATAELMKLFYRELLQPADGASAGAGKALRRAQQAMRSNPRWSAPYYWAGFVLQGEWRRFSRKARNPEDIGADEAGTVIRDPDSDQDMPSNGDELFAPPPDTQSATRSTGVAAGAPSGTFLEQFLEAAIEAETYDEKRHDPPEGIKPSALAETGWGVIFAQDTPRSVIQALRPLLDRREQLITEAGNGRHYKEFTYQPETSAVSFLSSERVPVGETGHPDRIPYYLMLVGSPDQIPFEFQYDLDLQYAVGRLDLGSADAYRAYANRVIDAEKGRIRLTKELALFAARGDSASDRTATELVSGLAERLREQPDDWHIRDFSQPGLGTKDQLAKLLGGDQATAVLFASAHGLWFSPGHDRQLDMQGALTSTTWETLEPEDHGGPSRVFSADDLQLGSRPGQIAFFFACYGAGTPELQTLWRKSDVSARAAPAPFTSRLARGLLGQDGGALAVVGHVERTWTSAFSTEDGDRQIESFLSAIRRLMAGHPVGSATSRIDLRRGQVAAHLHSLSTRGDLSPLEGRLHDRLWREYLDARNFIVLGDPAVTAALGRLRS